MTCRWRDLTSWQLALLLGCGAVSGQLVYPEGTQNFESLSVGQDASALPDFGVIIDAAVPAQFEVVGANDVNGSVGPRGASTRWLRFTDTENAATANGRMYFDPIVAPVDEEYNWQLWVNLEITPPGGANAKPKITIQHRDNASVFQNAWGIEFTDTGANLIVLGIGGSAGSVQLYPLSGATGVGQWVKINLRVRFGSGTIFASANDGPEVSLPINLNGNKKEFRWCYRGEGAGNVMRLLVDDIAVDVLGPPPVPTLSGSGLIVMCVLLAIAAIVAVRRWKPMPVAG